MTWFETLTGFPETSPDLVRANLLLDGNRLTSVVNKRSFSAGEFMTPSLEALRETIEIPSNDNPIKVDELIADVQSLHQDSGNANAVFQVASQFNCLEMAAPHLVPEDGVGIYQNDRTQGPACCICAGAGTIYRNYFVEHNGQVGQTADCQIDCLAGIAHYFENAERKHWRLQNGYCFPSAEGLNEIEQRLSKCSEMQLDEIRKKLMVGVQSDTEITIGDSPHKVTQVFCSALPVAYSNVSRSKWNHFPRLILDATYELTFYTALQNFMNTGCPKLYLTLVGGGVFGNKLDWILSAIDRSLKLFTNSGLDVKIVSYRRSNTEVAKFLTQYRD